MKIYQFTENVELLRPVIESWQVECNANVLGLEEDMAVYLNDLQRLIDSNDSDLFVLEKDSKIVGYMGLAIFRSPLGNQLIANEHYWYVIPSARGVSSLKMLVVAQGWAKLKGCSHLLANASCLAGDMHDKACQIYEKFGMRKFETTYIKVL